ncbi:N/A [soil metagenome]
MSSTISELGRKVGVRPDTIRYYERVGLLRSPERNSSGYRVYGEEDLERLRFIRGAQRLGLRLSDIRELLAIRDRGACPCGHTATLVRGRVSEVDAEIDRLTRLRVEMIRLADAIPEEAGSGEPWPCERQFIEVGGR